MGLVGLFPLLTQVCPSPQGARSVQSTEALTVRRKMLCTAITCLGSSQAVGDAGRRGQGRGSSPQAPPSCPNSTSAGKEDEPPRTVQNCPGRWFCFSIKIRHTVLGACACGWTVSQSLENTRTKTAPLPQLPTCILTPLRAGLSLQGLFRGQRNCSSHCHLHLGPLVLVRGFQGLWTGKFLLPRKNPQFCIVSMPTRSA